MNTYLIFDGVNTENIHTRFSEFCKIRRNDPETMHCSTAELKADFEYLINDQAAFKEITVYPVTEYFKRPDYIDFDID